MLRGPLGRGKSGTGRKGFGYNFVGLKAHQPGGTRDSKPMELEGDRQFPLNFRQEKEKTAGREILMSASRDKQSSGMGRGEIHSLLRGNG